MLEQPNIPESVIIDTLQKQYGLIEVKIEFLPIGNDVNSAVYRVKGDNQEQLYLKLRRGDFNKASVMVPYLLNEHGVKQVISPKTTQNGEEWTTLNEYSLALYPFIEGKNGFQQPLSDKQWIELGSAVKGLHTLTVPQDVAAAIPREDFSPIHRNAVRDIMRQLDSVKYPDQVAERLADFLKQNEKDVIYLVDRAEELGKELNKQDFVLCHADLHAANLLIGQEDELHIIDWDTLIFAPKERDLMFIGGGIGGAWNKQEEEELFYKGYGATEINPTALNYYRYERIVEDIEEFSKRILLTGEGGRDREKSLKQFMNAFLPNNVVEIAKREGSK